MAFKSEGAEVPERDGEVLYLEIGFSVRRLFVVFGLYDKVLVPDLPGRGLEDALG